jgi:cytochrome c oxidase cbb3-type subunit 3/ubiquinol-cytochrome c reductase cytochrome c subunit
VAPTEVADVRALYADNCAACHGPNGRGGAALALADPVYLAIVDDRLMRSQIADGVPGTSMPAFGELAGGSLTAKQIALIVSGIRGWEQPGDLGGSRPPSYTPASTADLERGSVAYRRFCESCHGLDGAGTPRGSAIANDSFLALVSDQRLRTTVIAGRRDLGAPDWRGDLAGTPMSEQEVTDVVAWLASHRRESPGSPYFTSRNQER